jgi:hypothetical protein
MYHSTSRIQFNTATPQAQFTELSSIRERRPVRRTSDFFSIIFKMWPLRNIWPVLEIRDIAHWVSDISRSSQMTTMAPPRDFIVFIAGTLLRYDTLFYPRGHWSSAIGSASPAARPTRILRWPMATQRSTPSLLGQMSLFAAL